MSMAEDWRGEHFIRGVPRDKFQQNGWNVGAGKGKEKRVQDKAKQVKKTGVREKRKYSKRVHEIRICAAPHCDTEVSYRSTTGLCKLHLHYPGKCQCSQCKEKDFDKAK